MDGIASGCGALRLSLVAGTEKILLILDLDETLIHASEEQLDREADFRVFGYHVYIRPHLEPFRSLKRAGTTQAQRIRPARDARPWTDLVLSPLASGERKPRVFNGGGPSGGTEPLTFNSPRPEWAPSGASPAPLLLLIESLLASPHAPQSVGAPAPFSLGATSNFSGAPSVGPTLTPPAT
jgi:hypothetical protein